MFQFHKIPNFVKTLASAAAEDNFFFKHGAYLIESPYGVVRLMNMGGCWVGLFDHQPVII